MKYTGERLVPEEKKLKVLLVEDLAKFRFAGQHTRDKVVLDAGCGAGQGASYLAENGARSVTGVDIDPEAVEFARRKYRRDNLTFLVMSVENLSFPSKTFDVVTSIEVIEHLARYDQYIAGVARVLRPDGVYIISTPNKQRSSPRPGGMWPAHTREFFIHELREMLGQHFSRIEMWGESVPIYERHPIRRIVRYLAPYMKPILPRRLRTTALPMMYRMIKPDLALSDVCISPENLDDAPTIVVVCRK